MNMFAMFYLDRRRILITLSSICQCISYEFIILGVGLSYSGFDHNGESVNLSFILIVSSFLGANVQVGYKHS